MEALSPVKDWAARPGIIETVASINGVFAITLVTEPNTFRMPLTAMKQRQRAGNSLTALAQHFRDVGQQIQARPQARWRREAGACEWRTDKDNFADTFRILVQAINPPPVPERELKSFCGCCVSSLKDIL